MTALFTCEREREHGSISNDVYNKMCTAVEDAKCLMEMWRA